MDTVPGSNENPCNISNNSGGGSISCSAVPGDPTANAGSDQVVTEGTSPVTLDGTGSSDAETSVAEYAWIQIVNGATIVTLSDVTASQPTFDAPPVSTYEILTFSLVVKDTDGNTSPADTVNIVVYDPAVFNSVITGASGDVSIPSGQSYLVTGTAVISGSIELNGSTLVMLSGASVTSDVISVSGTSNNSITIDGASISGNVITKDATSTILLSITNSNTGTIELGNTSNITITGNTVSGDILNISGNSTPCTIGPSQATGSQFLCSVLP